MIRLVLSLTFLFLFTPSSFGKVYWLPDYLQENLDRNADRVNTPSTETPDGSTGSSCNMWNMYSLSEIEAKGLRTQDCQYETIPDVGTCYYNCTCPSQYKYTSANCSGRLVLSGSVCDGKYSQCICDKSIYTTNANIGCPIGKKIDTNSYCKGPSDTLPRYKCIDDSCYDMLSPSDCSNQGKVCVQDLSCTNKCTRCAYQCELEANLNCGNFECKQYYTDCPSKCEICYTDNCHIRDAVETPYGCEKYWDDCASKCEKAYADNCHNREDNTTDYGCQTYWDDCPSKCKVGKTCTPNDCSDFTLTSVPANASYETCTPGCGNATIYYKLIQCNSGYWDLNNFLCNTNQICTWKID